MQLDLIGKTALVTGGTRGIGAAIVQGLLSAGARVIATGRAVPAAGSWGSEHFSHRCHFEVIDLSDSRGTEAFAEKMSCESVDILVNNAGINHLSKASQVSFEEWNRIQQINVYAPMILCRSLAPRMAERGFGRILNITSIFGHVTRAERISYTTSKFALVGMTKTLAVEYAAHGVLVNGLAPGFIDTDLTRKNLSPEQRQEVCRMVPAGRLGRPEEIAQAAVFLVSAQNSFITGQNIIADGGFTLV